MFYTYSSKFINVCIISYRKLPSCFCGATTKFCLCQITKKLLPLPKSEFSCVYQHPHPSKKNHLLIYAALHKEDREGKNDKWMKRCMERWRQHRLCREMLAELWLCTNSKIIFSYFTAHTFCLFCSSCYTLLLSFFFLLLIIQRHEWSWFQS